ncbi:MAG: hypothetical protein R3D71_09645 [Rickettsiales bacterium]
MLKILVEEESISSKLVKGWCPSLEKPMESGDGLLVRIPIKFGLVSADILEKIADISAKYGNANLDLSNRGKLQIRGVRPATYEPLREELAGLGFIKDFMFNIIASQFDEGSQKFADKLYSALIAADIALPDKFLIVVDGGGVFPLSGLACDLYIPFLPSNKGRGQDEGDIIGSILEKLNAIKKCDKKIAAINSTRIPIGFISLDEESGVVIASPEFGEMEAWQLAEISGIAEKYGSGEVIFAPFRRVILPNIMVNNSTVVLSLLADLGFIINEKDPRFNIHACVGSPACSSALRDTRNFARSWIKDNPDNTKIVHITGCSKGCAYRGKADITMDLSEK